MGALLHDVAVVDDGDGIGVHDRAEAVGDDDRRAAFQNVLQGGLDGGFRLGVEAGGRFVENQHLRIAQDRTRQRDALFLAAGETDAAFADERVVFVRKLFDEIRGGGDFRGGGDLFGRGVRNAVGDVLRDRSVEEEDILQDETEEGAVGAELEVADILAVQRDGTVLRFVEADEQIRDRRLSDARRTDQSERLAGGNGQTEILQDGLAGVVFEIDVVEAQFFFQTAGGHGVRLVHDGELFVQHVEDTFRAGDAVLDV